MYIDGRIIYKSISRAKSNRIGSIRGRRTRPERSSTGLVVGVGIRIWAIALEVGIVLNAYTISTFWLLFIDECLTGGRTGLRSVILAGTAVG